MDLSKYDIEKLKSFDNLTIPIVINFLGVSYSTAERILITLEREGKLDYRGIKSGKREFKMWVWKDKSDINDILMKAQRITRLDISILSFLLEMRRATLREIGEYIAYLKLGNISYSDLANSLKRLEKFGFVLFVNEEHRMMIEINHTLYDTIKNFVNAWEMLFAGVKHGN